MLCDGLGWAAAAATLLRRTDDPPPPRQAQSIAPRSHGFEMRVAVLVELVVGIAHRFRLASTQHHLHVDRFETIVLITVNHTSRTRYAFPRTEPRGQTLAGFVLDEHVHVALEDEEDLLDLVGVRRVALAGRHEHDGKRKILGRNDGRIAVLSRTTGADKAVLRALVAFDLRVLQGGPIGPAVAEAPDKSLHDLLDRYTDELGGAGVPCDGHSHTPFQQLLSRKLQRLPQDWHPI